MDLLEFNNALFKAMSFYSFFFSFQTILPSIYINIKYVRSYPLTNFGICLGNSTPQSNRFKCLRIT